MQRNEEMSSTTITIEWLYSPTDYFEEPYKFSYKGHTIQVDQGIIKALVNDQNIDTSSSLCDEIYEELNLRFLGALLVTFVPFQIFKSPTVVKNGQKHTFITVKDTIRLSCTLEIDVSTTSPNGNIINSKQERFNKKITTSDLIVKHKSDKPLLRMLRSYNNATRDPDDELIHLYEIRDILCSTLDCKKKSIPNLSITEENLTKFNKICNELPVRQGRHRGNHKNLRYATHEELVFARDFTHCMITEYLKYLKSGYISEA